MDIAEGYKLTEIGVIPEDWDVKQFKDVFTFYPNNTYARDFMNDVEGVVHNIHYGDVLIKYECVVDFDKDTVPYLNADTTKYTDRTLIKDGDIIIADTAEDETVGKCVEVYGLGNKKAVSGLHTMLCRPKEGLFVPKFLGYLMNGSIYHNQLLPLMVGTKVSSVSKSAIVDTYIPIPPKHVQVKIVNSILSIDELICPINTEISKKKQLKEGTMQQLLTGKTRLPGFNGAWLDKQIGKIGYTYSGITGKGKDDFGKGDAQYITFLNVLNNPVIDTTIFEKVDIKPSDRQNAAQKGDLFFNTSSETPEEVGICAVLNENIENLYLNSFCFGYRLTDNAVLGHYLAYFWRSKQGRDIMSTLAQGATRYNLSKVYFNQTVITLPPTKDEQMAIVEVLDTMDDEIHALEVERDKYLQIKQGMMQKLLTGQIRLK